MSRYVITITREFGSLGRPIAKRLSEILGIEYYDRDIVEEVSKTLNLPVSVISWSYHRWYRLFCTWTDCYHCHWNFISVICKYEIY